MSLASVGKLAIVPDAPAPTLPGSRTVDCALAREKAFWTAGSTAVGKARMRRTEESCEFQESLCGSLAGVVDVSVGWSLSSTLLRLTWTSFKLLSAMSSSSGAGELEKLLSHEVL